jgi:hypothetical protein
MRYVRNASSSRKIGKPSLGSAIQIPETVKGIAAGSVRKGRPVSVSRSVCDLFIKADLHSIALIQAAQKVCPPRGNAAHAA